MSEGLNVLDNLAAGYRQADASSYAQLPIDRDDLVLGSLDNPSLAIMSMPIKVIPEHTSQANEDNGSRFTEIDIEDHSVQEVSIRNEERSKLKRRFASFSHYLLIEDNVGQIAYLGNKDPTFTAAPEPVDVNGVAAGDKKYVSQLNLT